MPVDKKALANAAERAAQKAAEKDSGSTVVQAAMTAAAMRFLVAHVDALEERLGAIEATPFTYAGTFEPGHVYDKNVFVTDGGSIWCARYKTASRPGDGGPGWVLACKRGKDGKDLR